jgi:hypothetical protein
MYLQSISRKLALFCIPLPPEDEDPSLAAAASLCFLRASSAAAAGLVLVHGLAKLLQSDTTQLAQTMMKMHETSERMSTRMSTMLTSMTAALEATAVERRRDKGTL